MIGLIDYGVGNLFSLKSSFSAINQEATVLNNPDDLDDADRIILPGVGAFGDAIRKLKESGMADALLKQVEKGKPVLGICLGMQLLFDKSYEYGENRGLSLISGEVVPIKDLTKEVKIPHMGWNALEIVKPSSLFKYVNDGDYVYFVHSYAAKCQNVSAVTLYGAQITAAVEKDNVYGCQFHPEKSGKVGLDILKAFCEV